MVVQRDFCQSVWIAIAVIDVGRLIRKRRKLVLPFPRALPANADSSPAIAERWSRSARTTLNAAWPLPASFAETEFKARGFNR